MKKLLTTALLLISINYIYCQEILIPYRVGDKFGFSDLKGNMIIQPEYDRVTLKTKYPRGFFVTSKNGKHSILFNKKEIISNSDCSDFDYYKNKFIVGEKHESYHEKVSFKTREEYDYYNKRRDYKSLFSINGANIYPDNFKELRVIDTAGVSTTNKHLTKYIMFISENFDRQKSLFVYDCDKQQISEWLIKDYYRLVINRETMNRRDFEFDAQKNKNDTVQKFKLVFEKQKLKLVNLKTENTHKTETDSYSGYGTADYDIEGGVGDYFGGVAESVSEFQETHRLINSKFSIVDGKIIYALTEDKKEDDIKEIKLPYPIENIKTENLFRTTFSSKEKTIQSTNLVIFTSNNKRGLVLSDSNIIKPLYDTIVSLQYYNWGNQKKDKNMDCFFVGIKDKETQRMKYGTIDIKGNIIIPIIYDDIDYSSRISSRMKNQFSHATGKSEWKVKKDGKYGFISPVHEIVVEIVYDEIAENELNYMYFESDFLLLKKDNKYGLIIGQEKDKIIIEPVFLKKPGYYIKDYQYLKGKLILGLVDENDKFFSYANTDGSLFYKE